ncbi:hypothetical protein RJ639_000949 [Escallonia herrerae]|uniref:MICOS complex subunit MIC60 n=1 Tax=Escallonia herrerae TaxID=1293975 RepID=A0AA88XAJ0_9ASTE|nr:hypothetical protein RJ639_000949 [Escallonia herrerae]
MRYVLGYWKGGLGLLIWQIPSYLSSRKEFSVASGSSGQDKPQHYVAYIFGGATLCAAGMAAHQAGYFDKLLVKEPRIVRDSAENDNVKKGPEHLQKISEDTPGHEHIGEQNPMPNFQESSVSDSDMQHKLENNEADTAVTYPEVSKSEAKNKSQVKDVSEELPSGMAKIGSRVKGVSDLMPQEDMTSIQDNELASSPQQSITSNSESSSSGTLSVEHLDKTNQEEKPSTKKHESPTTTLVPGQGNVVSQEDEAKFLPPQHLKTEHMPGLFKDTFFQDGIVTGVEKSSSLLDAYSLREKNEETATAALPEQKELDGAAKDLDGAYTLKDRKVVLDILEAIREAENRQAELDAHFFHEEMRKIKEKYEKGLKDARARELMYAEREAILDKELKKERAKAIAALKSLQEELEEKHKMEFEWKEAEEDLKLEKVQELANAKLAATIASEKASQIEKWTEANLNISALCMAFYARSEEARQSHSVHKLSLGAVALEDALSKGLPIQKEIDALHTYLEGIDKDSLLDLVLSSLPEETRKYGTNTLLQLNLKARYFEPGNLFDALKGTLRHFSLLPPGGGGILAHSLAHVASRLKVKEVDQSGDGIESLISRVESFLAEGKLLEAAASLEAGVEGSQAADVVGDWVKQARNRAITEQALTVLQSYATSISLT